MYIYVIYIYIYVYIYSVQQNPRRRMSNSGHLKTHDQLAELILLNRKEKKNVCLGKDKVFSQVPILALDPLASSLTSTQ